MNQQQINMAQMAGAGGPVGGTPLVNSGSRGGTNQSRGRLEQLNTYIYDYFLRNELWDVARAMQKASKVGGDAMPLLLGDLKSSPSGRDVNGVGDAMDTDNKDFKRPADLPEPGHNLGVASSCFLSDWFAQFWDMYQGQRGQGGGSMAAYISTNQSQQRMRQENQNRIMQNADPNRQMMMFNRMQQQNGMPPDMQKAAMLNRGNLNPQQQQMMRNQMMQKMNNMQRPDGPNMNMGDQRSQSPGSGDNNAPSPKRQRMEGNFNGQMGPAGRGQGMPGQPGNIQGPNGPPMLLQNGLNPEQMQLQQKQQFEAMNQGAQGSPMTQPNPDGGNHALQDYQMQLMLLEQQNKKRLLMARQEQDSMSHPPPGSGPVPPGGFAAPAMSPSGSRAGGPSPNPAEMAKRGTPKMGPGTLPNPNSPADPNLQGNRGSPAPSFDPNQMAQGGMNQFYPMAMQGMQPPSSHPRQPGMPQMSAQQMAELQRNGGRMPNGQPFPPGAMMQNPQQAAQQGQQPGQPPMGTPRQPTNMGPPPAPPAGGEPGRTNPPSPSQQTAQPPTPSQAAKNIPNKGAKKDKQPTKKAGNKGKNQGNTGATPASEAEPPTPTPSTPITPMHPNSFNGGKTGAQPVPGGAAQQPPAAAAQPAPAPGGLDPNAPAPFGDISGDGFNLDMANFDSGDVLENFDFDSFLHTDGGEGAFAFDGLNFGPTDGVEAGGDV